VDGAATATEPAGSTAPLDKSLGVFFSIYYCMTGLHAVHIIAGIIALAWIFYRSLAAQWRPDYFGPVDFVGLYWHLVDLIWIYLFPLMYLIR
jgi:cytochrome c oxidase subunit 3